jgi:hypothetical protein
MTRTPLYERAIASEMVAFALAPVCMVARQRRHSVHRVLTYEHKFSISSSEVIEARVFPFAS